MRLCVVLWEMGGEDRPVVSGHCLVTVWSLESHLIMG